MRFAAATLVFASWIVGLGCSAAPADPSSDDAVSAEEALKGGCRYKCPKCHPGEVCPKIACFLECPGGKTPCGENVCNKGEYCCNESCGLCAPEGGFCTQEYCGPTGSACTTDADCAAVADYCIGCNCLALGAGELPPVCDGSGVQCFSDPCQGNTAVCLDGACSLVSAF